MRRIQSSVQHLLLMLVFFFLIPTTFLCIGLKKTTKQKQKLDSNQPWSCAIVWTFVCFQSGGRRCFQLESQRQKQRRKLFYTAAFILAVSATRLVGGDSDGNLYRLSVGVSATCAPRNLLFAHNYNWGYTGEACNVLCQLSEELEKRVAVTIWYLATGWCLVSYALPPTLLLYLDFKPAAFTLVFKVVTMHPLLWPECIYTCTSVWSSTMRLQSDHVKHILMKGHLLLLPVKEVKVNLDVMRETTTYQRDFFLSVLALWFACIAACWHLGGAAELHTDKVTRNSHHSKLYRRDFSVFLFYIIFIFIYSLN